ncbi:DUF4349 domain-containing protein [Streptomyces poriticola]|uniref:DUF4349 domain-containing protein n=1 Tax=Streptomyces poriticola TaxID=3120506 RepID=UPI002FCE4C00
MRTRTRPSVRPVPALAALLLAAALSLTGCSSSADTDESAGGAAKGVAGPAEGAADGRAESRADGGGQAQEAQQDSGQGAPGASGDRAPASAPPLRGANHIIRTASLTVRVEDVPKALDEARTAVGAAGGYVGDETTDRDGEGHERTRLVLRVPVGEYDEVLAALEGAGELVERTAKAEDVTDRVVDVESRIKSQRASVARVRELMDRATELGDVVTLEGELSSRQAELESLLARQAALKDRTSLATVTLTLSGTPVDRTGEDDGTGFLDALAGGWDAFLTMLRWLAVAIGAALPFTVVAALLVLLWLRVVRPRLRPRTPEQD